MPLVKKITDLENLRNVEESEAAKSLSNCIFIFIIQLGIMILMYYRVTATEFIVYTPNFQHFLARVIVAVLLHMQLESEVRQALDRFNCTRYNIPNNSDNKFPMLLTSFF